MSRRACITCGSRDLLVLDTYKRHWYCCRNCGDAFSVQKKRYPLAFLPYADLRAGVVTDEAAMYDYFVDRSHIEWSEREGSEFVARYLKPAHVEVARKNLLDISGGNGHFIREIAKRGAHRVTMTEINQKAIEYARQRHGFDVVEYNLNRDDLQAVTRQRFDVIFARACVMFARDLEKFADELRRCTAPGGIVMINHAVVPTLGVMLRTQLDEFSYLVLRQPDSIIKAFAKQGFELQHRADETDPDLYVYDHDLLRRWRWLYLFYESRNLRRLASDRRFAWPARDRRRSTLVFRLASREPIC